MTVGKCGDSLKGAKEFFSRHFPDRRFNAIASTSWIFNPRLQEVLPQHSNLTRFQKEVFLFPVPSTGKDGLWFIFFTEEIHPGRLPRKTSLQRAVADLLEAGGDWRGGGMFCFTEHLEHFGTGFYLKTMPQ